MSASALLFAQTPNPVQQENSLPGTPGWDDFTASSQQDLLSGFGSKISVNHGDSIGFYVTTTAPSFTVDIYRTGYYQGIGARLVQSLGSFPGVYQTIPAPDPVTGMVACSNWTAATTLQIPSSWVTGVYLAKLTSSTGNSSFIFFVVRNDGGTEDLLYQASVTTYQAYNLWGGTSLYGNTTDKSVYPYAHATKVSFDRPFIPGDSNGAGQYLDYEYAFVYWAESQGYNISYSTDVDTDQGAVPIANHRAFLSVGHDEYWSRAMRTNLQNAINSGVNVGFFGANTMFWQIRYEPNASGAPNRVQVDYKDFATSPSAPGPDPQWGFDNSIVTTQWRDPTINEPENGVVGVMSESAASADYVVQNSSNWVYANSGFVDGSSVPGLIGYEYDKVWDNGFTPPGLVVLSTSPLTNSSGASSYSNSSMYTAQSGAKVFASGTIVWSLGLANVLSNNRANAGIQQTTANLLNNFILGVPVATLSPGTANFNGVTVGITSSPQTITLTNAGTGTLNIASIGLAGANPGDFAQTNNCPATLVVNQSCAINVTFTPTAAGPRSASLSIADDAANSPQGVSLSGTGQAAAAPIVSFNPASLTFGSQNVGTSSAAQTVTLSNVGTASLSIGSIAITGLNSGDFSSTNTCPNLLAANASCTINVTFSPVAGGTRSASLTVTDNAADSPQSVALTGSAFAPTVYFQDGFESGNFNLWNLPSSDSTGQRTIQTQVVNSGTSATAFTDSAGQYGYLYTALASPQTQTFTRFYLRLTNTTSSTQVAIARNANGSNTWEIDYDANRHGLDIYFWDGSGAVYSLFSATNSIAANTWYCVEIGDTQTATGQAQAWLNGVSLGTLNADLSNANPFARLMLLNTVTGTFYFDDVVVSNFYNGPVTSKPAASLNPASVTFGNQPIGTTSIAQTVTLSNQGAAPLTISNIALNGTNSGDFAQTNNCPTGSNILGVNTSCTINITFTPGATGARSAALVITDNDPTGTQSVALSGSGTTGGITLTPTSLTYSTQIVGTTSAAQTITVKSTGAAPLSIGSITLSGTNPGDFAQTNNCPTGTNTLAVNATCTINVTFSPTAGGTRSATLAIADNAPTHVQNVALSGSATAANLILTPLSLTFSSQVVGTTSTAQTITVKSTGTAPLKISGIAFGGTNAGDFAQTNNCPTGTNTLAINATCTISVTFKPTARGTRAATLTVNSNAPVTAPSVSLSGTGIGPVASLSPASLTFSALNVGTTSGAQSITLTNTGNSTLHITSIAVTGDFAQTTNCSSTLGAGASCTVKITFTPTVAGTRSGTMTVTDDSTAGSTQTTSLTGTGLDFAVSASPSSATVTAGSKANYTITVSALGGSFNSSVKLACSNVPLAAKCTFTSTSLTPGGGSASTTLSISTTGGLLGTPRGTYTITVSGTTGSGSLTHTTPVTLQVN